MKTKLTIVLILLFGLKLNLSAQNLRDSLKKYNEVLRVNKMKGITELMDSTYWKTAEYKSFYRRQIDVLLNAKNKINGRKAINK